MRILIKELCQHFPFSYRNTGRGLGERYMRNGDQKRSSNSLRSVLSVVLSSIKF